MQVLFVEHFYLKSYKTICIKKTVYKKLKDVKKDSCQGTLRLVNKLKWNKVLRNSEIYTTDSGTY